MTTKGIFHDVVKVALPKTGWRMTHDSLIVLAAEKDRHLLQNTRKIAIEVKRFVGLTSVVKLEQRLVNLFVNLKTPKPSAHRHSLKTKSQ